MSIDLYSPTAKDRVNPEFVGIAKKHSSYKKRRQQIENQRDHYLRALKYKISVDLNLEKSLEEQKDRLKVVKSTHHRKNADEDFKREFEENKKNKLRSLSFSVKDKREENKRNIRTALVHVFSRNRRSQQEGKLHHEMIASKLREREHSLSFDNRKKYKEVKLGEKQSLDTVNRFYRSINKESLNAYQSWITEESDRANEYTNQIQMMETAIAKVDRQIDKKKGLLFNVFSEIEGYTSESTIEQSKCLPSYLRTNLSSSSHSSRPRDLLLKGPKEIIEKKIISSVL